MLTSSNKLFATLDPTARALKLPHGQTVMLIDTVGFLRRLPHHLVEAFHSTLEEASQADVILNVCDASSPECAEHLRVTNTLLGELGCADRPIIPVMNKCDRVEGIMQMPVIGETVRISAKHGTGIDELLLRIEERLPKVFRTELLLPYTEAGVLADIRKYAQLLSEEYTEDGIRVCTLLDGIWYERLKKYLFTEAE